MAIAQRASHTGARICTVSSRVAGVNIQSQLTNLGQHFAPSGYLPTAVSSGVCGSVRFRRDKKSVGDRRLILLKNMLVPGSKPVYETEIKAERRTPEEYYTPVDVDITKSPENVRREVIERAWCLLKEEESIEKTQELFRMYKSLHTASEDLKSKFPDLYNKIEAERGLGYLPMFPMELRIPSYTPPTNGWPELPKDDVESSK